MSVDPATAPVEETKSSPETQTFECVWNETTKNIDLPVSNKIALENIQAEIKSKFSEIAELSVVFRYDNADAGTMGIESIADWENMVGNGHRRLFVVPADEQTSFDFSRTIQQLNDTSKVRPLSVLEEEVARNNTDDDGDSQMGDAAESGEETKTNAVTEPATSAPRSNLPWGEGVGYGCSYDNSDWDMDSWRFGLTSYYTKLARILERVNERLEKCDVDLHIVLGSCLVPLCIESVSSSSLAVMKANENFYRQVFRAIALLVKNEVTRDIVRADVLVTATSRGNLWNAFSNLHRQASQAVSLSSSALDQTDFVDDVVTRYSEAREALCLSDEQLPDEDEKTTAPTKDVSYIEAMSPLAFDTVSSFTNQKYEAEIGDNTPLSDKRLIRRLAGEYADISVSLPCTEESSIFVRVHETRMNFCRFLIVPADETPYAAGCFIFDVHFSSSYPDGPPKVNLSTTGGGTVRFNPNLYNDGYVCLSLLGTWDAESQGEEWNPGVSTFLQVVISVQSLIFVPDPYWNEPGFEANANDPGEQANCQAYNKDKQLNTVRWAMIDMLVNPPEEFKSVILRHFYLSKDRCLRNAKMWLGDSHELVVKLDYLLSQLHKIDSLAVPKQPSAEELAALSGNDASASKPTESVPSDANNTETEQPDEDVEVTDATSVVTEVSIPEPMNVDQNEE